MPTTAKADTAPNVETNGGECSSLVPQIIEAHEAIGVAEAEGRRNSLDRAIECGRLLTLAKETVTKGKARAGWQKWIKDNLAEYAWSECVDTGCKWPRSISQTTVSLYMRIYAHRDELRATAEHQVDQAARRTNPEVSIRWADDLLKNKAYVERDQKRTPEQREEIKAKVAKMQAAKAAKAEAEADDEANQAEAAHIERSPSWLKVTLKKAAAEDVFAAIKESWSEDEITKLGEMCRQLHHSEKLVAMYNLEMRHSQWAT